MTAAADGGRRFADAGLIAIDLSIDVGHIQHSWRWQTKE
jgi:hypothetical protein